MRIAIIGSGPAGWSATSKLLEKGHDVTVFTCDTKDTELKDQVSFATNKTKINSKLLHGSDFPYRNFPTGPKKRQKEVNVPTSFAFSGLSLVWGATMLPYSQADIENWPVTAHELDPYYKYVLEGVPVTGRFDDLAKHYPPYFNQRPLLPSKRISQLIGASQKANSSKFTLGSSRLAVQLLSEKKLGCTYCAKCLIGCPSDFIWSSPQISHSRLVYKKNHRVISISENPDTISVKLLNDEGEIQEYCDFDKVYVAAGNVESFRILATSGLVPSRAELNDSRTFFVPFLLSSKYGKTEDRLNTLSQLFVRYEGGKSHPLQIQIYDYSDDLITRAKQAVPLGKFIPDRLLKILLSRLFVGIGYLDSRDSSKICLELTSDDDVHLFPSTRSANLEKNIVVSFFKDERKFFKHVGLRPLPRLIQYALPGEGVHSGGWLPMGALSNDLGTPFGSTNVHVVDSSIFPFIPAGAITFTVMANAARIADRSTR